MDSNNAEVVFMILAVMGCMGDRSIPIPTNCHWRTFAFQLENYARREMTPIEFNGGDDIRIPEIIPFLVLRFRDHEGLRQPNSVPFPGRMHIFQT